MSAYYQIHILLRENVDLVAFRSIISTGIVCNE